MFNGERRSGLDSLFGLVSWQIWKERNARCFRDSTATINDLLQLIKDEADRWIEAGAGGLAAFWRRPRDATLQLELRIVSFKT